jgi:hypothetical protein
MKSIFFRTTKVFAIAARPIVFPLAVSFALALAVGFHVDTASAWTKKLNATRSQVASACGAVQDGLCANCGGTSGGYSCDNPNNGCYVQCDAKGNCNGGCPGKEPARTAPVRGIYGVLTGGGRLAQPGTPSSRPPKPGTSPVTGGILDGGSGFGSQGPAATGSPLSPGRGTAPPPGRVN